ncbi:hypothetical protein I302_106877 [Kwoniella bestiolae CBS 10118]|uniref:Protein CPL1-like domain-containing protein n=1 Tax=Kwoniella bestiolae CBS 10118 TaxID=1296100 RepID=A0AAJ8KCN5_9TREE
MSFKSIIIALPFLLAATASASASTESQEHNIFLGCTDPIRPLKVNADSVSSCVESCGSSASKNTFAYWLGGDEASCVCSGFGPAEEYDIAFPRGSSEGQCDDHEVAVFVTKSGHSFQHQPKRSKSSRFRRSLPTPRDSSNCPEPLTACNVAGDSSSYQCIDPQFALNSCGGCIHGDFGSTSTSTSAVDCSKLEGVAEGGVICSGGQCKAYRCLDGYKLTSANTCVKK